MPWAGLCPGTGPAPPHITHTVQNVLGSNHTNMLSTIPLALGESPNSRVLKGYSPVDQGVLAGLPHPSGQLDPGEKETRISHGHGSLTGPVHLEIQNDPREHVERAEGPVKRAGRPQPQM